MTGQGAAEGCRVTLHFVLLLSDGTLVDRSDEGEPLTITLGRNDLTAGLEHCLLGLHPGDKRRFDIPAAQAYGLRLAENVHVIPRTQFPPQMGLEPGTVIEFSMPTGEEVPGTVMAVADTEVAVDFSHPLAGHDLVFDVEILAVAPGPVVPSG
ncbi:MAG: peptidylprolyl isomerase [Gammaproteobacteria bacterium]|nr:peptidylprolyl isomerase [Gammaproteobacteria bacterium]